MTEVDLIDAACVEGDMVFGFGDEAVDCELNAWE